MPKIVELRPTLNRSLRRQQQMDQHQAATPMSAPVSERFEKLVGAQKLVSKMLRKAEQGRSEARRDALQQKAQEIEAYGKKAFTHLEPKPKGD